MELKQFIKTILKEYYSHNNIIDDLFEQNPELKSIGTKEQYSNYLKTIFPNSKIKEIVFHGTMEQMIPKDNFKGYITYFTNSKNYAETFGFPVNRKIVAALINIQNPYIAPSELADVPEEIHDTDKFTNPRLIKYYGNSEHDSVIGVDAGQKNGQTFAIFEPEQIHILNNNKDIEGFRKFVRNNYL